MAAGPLESQVLGLIREVAELEVPGTESDLFETGILDSLAMMDLLERLEHTYGIEVQFEDVELDTFSTAKNIAAFLSRRI